MAARSKRVCVPCRKVYGGGGSSNRNNASRPGRVATVAPWRCTVCGEPMVEVSYRWRAPRRNNDRAWRRIEQGNWLWERDAKYDLPRGAWFGHRGKRRGRLLPRMR